MTNAPLIFEATQQITGNYECKEPPKPAESKDSGGESFERNNCNQTDTSPHHQHCDSEAKQQPYFIDAEQLFRINSPWANSQANVFQQTFQCNLQGGYSAYYQQMLQQFEQMRSVLNEQLSRHANFN